jgi:leucyl-tRNA synthetase
MITVDSGDGKGPVKMSKSEGNFFTVNELVTKYSADPVRVVLASAGDTMDDATFIKENVNKAILKLHHLYEFFSKNFNKESFGNYRGNDYTEET